MRPEKKLGQHFLRDPEVLREIVEVADVGRSAGALEIGSGEGALTAFLAATGRPIVALDLDERAIEAVRARLGDRVRAVRGDALEVDLASLLPPVDAGGRLPVVVGNLPYHAGTAIFRRLLLLGTRISRAVLMLQKEVAERIVAGPGSRAFGLLSVETALLARAWIVREVPPEAFWPRPKVDSAVVLAEPLPSPVLPDEERSRFLDFAGGLFSARRKTLANALGDAEALRRAGIDPAARPESLGVEDLLRLYEALPGASLYGGDPPS